MLQVKRVHLVVETQMVPIEPIQCAGVEGFANCPAGVICILDILEKFRPLISLENVSEVLFCFIP